MVMEHWRAAGKPNNYGGKGWGSIVLVLVLVVAKQGTAQDQGIYACWGGCVNQCIMSTKGNDSAQGLPCYWDCLGNCFSKTASDFKYYCQLGCSFKKCMIIANSSDGGGTEKCLEDCTNKICNTNP